MTYVEYMIGLQSALRIRSYNKLMIDRKLLIHKGVETPYQEKHHGEYNGAV